jgi:hypothetical protein
MAFTYVEANAATSNADYLSAVRSAIQDTVSAEAEFTDAEITAQYDATTSTDAQTVRNLTTAVKLARLLHRRYAKQASFSSQGTSVQLLDRAKYWASLVDDLERDLQVARMEAGQTDQGGILYAGRATGFLDQTGLDLGALAGGSLGGYIV